MKTYWYRALPIVLGVFGAIPIAFLSSTNASAQTSSGHSASTLALPKPTKVVWCGIYFNGKKVGYAHEVVEPISGKGPAVYKTSSDSAMRIQVLGASLEEKENYVATTDAKFQPLTETEDTTSNGSSQHVTAVYDYAQGKIFCTVGTGAEATKKTVDIPKGANLSGDDNFVMEGKKLQIGAKFEVYSLDHTTLQLQPIKIEVIGREEIQNEAGKKVPTFVVKEALPTGDGKVWITADGEPVKQMVSINPVEMVVTAEFKAHAQDKTFISPTITSGTSPAYVPADLALATSVKVNKEIADPRKLKDLQLTITGIPDKRLVISDDRQMTTVIGTGTANDSLVVDMHIRVDAPQTETAASLPITDPKLALYLEKAAYLDTGDAGLKAEAMKLKGSETNSLKVALAIRDWVNQIMTPDASIGVPRSATNIFGRQRGVCRDYATLYTALARIAGIPTRLCGGIVYADLDGHPAFYYHAWAESYVGSWVAVDPTLYDPSASIDYVDATHIKFGQGDVTQMFDSVSVVGKIKITLK